MVAQPRWKRFAGLASALVAQWPHAAFLALLGGAVALHVNNLGHPLIAQWDEAYHAVVAEHLELHPLHPTLYEVAALKLPGWDNWQGFIHTWLHIPPFGMWAAALSMHLLGDTPFALRLPSVVFVGIGMLATYLVGRRLFGAVAGLVGAIFIGYSPYALLLSQGYVFGDITDTPLLALTPLAVLALVQGLRASRNRYWWLLAAGILQGLCYLSKGALGLTPTGIALVLYACDWVFPAEEGWHRLGLRGLGVFLGAALVLAVPYNAYLARTFPAVYREESQNWVTGLFSNYEGWGRPADYHATSYLFAMYGSALALLLVCAVVTLAVVGLYRRSRADLIVVTWILALYIPLTLAVTKSVPMTFAAVSAFGLAVGRLAVLALSSRSLFARAATLGVLTAAVATSGWFLAGHTWPLEKEVYTQYGTFWPRQFWPYSLQDRLTPYLVELELSLAAGGLFAGALGLARRVGRRYPKGGITRLIERGLIATVVIAALAVLGTYWLRADMRVVTRPADNPGPVPALGILLRVHTPANATVVLTSKTMPASTIRILIMFWAHRDVYEIDSLKELAVCPLVREAAQSGSPLVILTDQPYPGPALGAADGWTLHTPVCP